MYGSIALLIATMTPVWFSLPTQYYKKGEFTTTGTYDPSVHLSLSDISVDRRTNPSVLFLRIKASKTDQFRKGHTLRLGRTNTSICAVQALVHFLQLRGSSPGPLFVFENGTPLSRDQLVAWTRDTLVRLGLDGNFSGHSFRIGVATTAAMVGIPDHLIKTMGRWLSDAYQIYIRTPPSVIDSVAARIVS